MVFAITVIIFVIAMIILVVLCHSQYKTYIALKEENEQLNKEHSFYKQELQEYQFNIGKTRAENEQLIARKQELNKDIADELQQVERLKESFEVTEEQFRRNYMNERKDWVEARQDEYLRMQEDFVEQFREENSKKIAAAKELSAKLIELQSAADAAIEVAKRHEEEENFIAYHSLQLEEKALIDIKRLEDIVPSISAEAGEAIAKVIWKVYYEKPFGDLVGRVLGSTHPTGIYRITNTRNSKCYVGQAVDIGDRWRQHIRRALNAEPRTQNKLYPAMYKEGLENFTFEIIEECSRDKLNEREDYWQEFYKAKEYGYSIK